ncbi:MAG TPA: urate oxidase [Thermoanaerobaculia bacterium]|jgi:urate oxidase|nr:urate oxidase [Thermoanaerobaculia bacterium]
MPAKLIGNGYGKSEVRLVTVRRGPDVHELKDVTVAIRLEGDFASAYTDGDNSQVLPTDTMKNTVYALAADHPVQDIEDFGLLLSDHFLRASPPAASARITLTEHLWDRLDPHCFRRAGGEKRTAMVTRTRDHVEVTAGIEDLVVMKTSKSAFEGFPRDRYTTLPETSDRLLASSVSATWKYARPDLPFGERWTEVRRRLLDAFLAHDSRSVQETEYAMGEAALETPDVEEIHLVMPNIHHIPVDLTRFGLENRNEVFVATSDPYGLIEVTLSRAGS